jgi:acyl-CoA thioester hydrolase
MVIVEVHRRFSDLDPLGHVNNVAFHDYLQEARVGLIGDLDGVLGPGFSQIVVSQQIRHHHPLPYAREPVRIEVWLESMARASYTLGYRILDNDGTLAAEATTTLAVIDPDTGRPIRIPDHIRERLT